MPAGLGSGLTNKLYRDTASSWATPTWDEITAAIDVSIGMSLSLAEVKARLSNFVQNLPGLKAVTVSFSMLADTSIADYNILRDAFAANTPIIYAVADQGITVSGADYFKLYAYVSKFDYKQGLEEADMVDVELALGYSSNVPAWTDVA